MGLSILVALISVSANAGNIGKPGAQTQYSDTQSQRASIAATANPAARLDSPEFMECGLRCAYLESSEVISEKSRHTLETMSLLKDVPLPDDPKKEAAKEQAAHDSIDQIIPGVCDFTNGETAKNCEIRWLKINIPYLNADRVAIKMNTAAAGELQNGKTFVNSKNGATLPDPSTPVQTPVMGLVEYRDPKEAAKKPIVTTMAKYDALKAQAALRVKTDPTLSPKNLEALTSEVASMTNVYKEDYYKTKEILRDPKDPKAGTYTVVVTGPDGNPVWDRQKWETDNRVKGKALHLEPDEMKHLHNTLAQVATMYQKQLTEPGSRGREIYNNVRSAVIGAAKRGLIKYGMVSPKAPQPARAVASTKDGKAVLSNNTLHGTSTSTMTGASAQIDPSLGKSVHDPDGEKDIDVPAVQDGNARPYFTVGYSDNVLGQEIENMQGQLGNLTK